MIGRTLISIALSLSVSSISAFVPPTVATGSQVALKVRRPFVRRPPANNFLSLQCTPYITHILSHHNILFAPHMKQRTQAAESEVSFSDDLDGSSIRIGVLRTRWNDEHVSNLVDGIKVKYIGIIF